MPRLLADSSLQSVAEYLKSDVCNNNVFVLCGAGISTSAGIPDFRSPNTGLYANLAKLNLPYPEAVFDIDFFLHNPQPFYTLARDIAPGKFIPTPTHAFIRLLYEQGKLHTCFTQNIDTLERRANVPDDKVIEAHGSFASSRCVECKTPYDNKRMMDHIVDARVPTCLDPDCGSLVKPDIVFFGESLPPQFINAVPALRSAALVIIMGTSLKVQPFAMLPNLVPRTGCPRLLLNLDPAGTIGMRIVSRRPSGAQADSDDEEEEDERDEQEEEEEEEEAWPDDVVHLGPCDTSVRELCDLLGWRGDLERIWKEVGGAVDSVGTAEFGKTTAGDIGGIGNTLGSMNHPAHSEELAKKSLRGAPVGDASVYPREGDGVAGVEPGEEQGERQEKEDKPLVHVKDNSVEKTVEKIVSDMQVALSISPNSKPNDAAAALDGTFTQEEAVEAAASLRDNLQSADAGSRSAEDLGGGQATTAAPPQTDTGPATRKDSEVV